MAECVTLPTCPAPTPQITLKQMLGSLYTTVGYKYKFSETKKKKNNTMNPSDFNGHIIRYIWVILQLGAILPS